MEQITQAGAQPLWDADVAAEYIGMSPKFLEADRRTQIYGIKFYRIGNRPKYRRSDLDAWLETRACGVAA